MSNKPTQIRPTLFPTENFTCEVVLKVDYRGLKSGDRVKCIAEKQRLSGLWQLYSIVGEPFFLIVGDEHDLNKIVKYHLPDLKTDAENEEPA